MSSRGSEPEAKPPGLGPEYAAQFQDPAVAAAYSLRAPYVPSAAERLLSLRTGTRTPLLELGCGSGDFTRLLDPRAWQITAVDPSQPLLTIAQERLRGCDVDWRHGYAEEQEFHDASFQVVLCAECIHWMDWPRLFARLRHWLSPSGWLVLANRRGYDPAWLEVATPLIARYSTNREYVPYNTVEALQARGYIDIADSWTSPPMAVSASVHEVIESFHGRNGFSKDRMPPADQRAFADAMRACLSPFADDAGVMRWETTTTLVISRPAR